MTKRIFLILGTLLMASSALWADLIVTVVPTVPTSKRVVVSQTLGRKGPTSIRFFTQQSEHRNRKVSPNPMDPNEGRYWKHDRDLGQTFTTPPGSQKFRLDAITLRVGPSPADGDIMGALKAKVSMQLYKVTGTPVINNNGTRGATIVSKAYNNKATSAMADDYITGETYTSLTVARGGVLPEALAVGESNTVSPTAESKGSYLRWDLTGADEIVLEPDSVYAFLVLFDVPGDNVRGLPLDNWDYLNQVGVPMEQVITGPYAKGHAIRRAGRIDKPWETPEKLRMAFNGMEADNSASAFPANFSARTALTPGTWGRPDVDTYRDLVFFIEADPIDTPAPAE